MTTDSLIGLAPIYIPLLLVWVLAIIVAAVTELREEMDTDTQHLAPGQPFFRVSTATMATAVLSGAFGVVVPPLLFVWLLTVSMALVAGTIRLIRDRTFTAAAILTVSVLNTGFMIWVMR